MQIASELAPVSSQTLCESVLSSVEHFRFDMKSCQFLTAGIVKF